MIASSDHKGEKPSGYIAVQVTFDTGFNTDKLYTYWVPSVWRVQPGDKLEVFVSHSTGHKWTTVRFVGGLTLRGAEHKCATRYKAMLRDREITKEMAEAAHKSTDELFEEMQRIGKETDKWCDLDCRGLEDRVVSHLIDDRFEGLPPPTPMPPVLTAARTLQQRMYEAMAVPPGLLTMHMFDFKNTRTGRISGIGPDQSNIPKESTMIDIKTITFINGKPVEECTDDELFAAIRKDEAEIDDLLKIENKPKALKDRVTKLEAGIKALVAMMDARP